jgi:predicted dehydrogenase
VRSVDVSPAAGEWARQRGLPFTHDLAEALRDPEVEAVILCTPHSKHREQIAQAAAAKKHVFCEKPLALSRRDALEAVAACRAAGVVLGVGHERRFEPPMLELKRLAKSGEIGTLLQIEANFSQDKFLAMPPDNWRLSSSEAPAGPMTATGIHLLDLSVSLLGAADRVVANARQLGSQLANGDTLGVLVGFKSGANALISAMLATPFAGRFAVYGNKGWVEVRDKAHPETPKGWTLTKCMRGGDAESVEYPAAPAVRANLEAFADAVAGRAPYPMPQEEMVANISALEAIFKSAAKGGTVEMVEG